MATEWNIRNNGRAWTGEEGFERYSLAPSKIELPKRYLMQLPSRRFTCFTSKP